METFSEFTLNKIIPDNYYLKGALSGMFGICLSHPVDTIKTTRQTLINSSTNSIQTLNLTVHIGSTVDRCNSHRWTGQRFKDLGYL